MIHSCNSTRALTSPLATAMVRRSGTTAGAMKYRAVMGDSLNPRRW